MKCLRHGNSCRSTNVLFVFLNLHHLLLLLVVVVVLRNGGVLVDGAIHGPVSLDDDVPIRLSSSLSSFSNGNNRGRRKKPKTTPHEWILHDPPSEMRYETIQGRTRSTTTSSSSSSNSHTAQQQQQQQSPPSSPQVVAEGITIEIVEPPSESYIAGTNFFVKVSIRINMNESSEEEKLVDRFKKEYSTHNNGRICLSLDDGLFHCWKLDLEDGPHSLRGEQILFTNVSDGAHSIVAMLYKGGDEKLQVEQEIATTTSTFTMVHNPEFEDDEHSIQYHDQLSSWNNRHDVNNNDDDEEQSTATTTTPGVEVSYPVVQILNPVEGVAYTGTEIYVDTLVQPQDPILFQKYFKHGFTCFHVAVEQDVGGGEIGNIKDSTIYDNDDTYDGGSEHHKYEQQQQQGILLVDEEEETNHKPYACFPLFDHHDDLHGNNDDTAKNDIGDRTTLIRPTRNRRPLILGVKEGVKYTIEAILSNPQTRDILPDSSSSSSSILYNGDNYGHDHHHRRGGPGRRHRSFFMAGEDNIHAYAVVDISIQGSMYQVPLVVGSSIVQQAYYLCSLVSNSSGGSDDKEKDHDDGHHGDGGHRRRNDLNNHCVEPVLQHLQMKRSEVVKNRNNYRRSSGGDSSGSYDDNDEVNEL